MKTGKKILFYFKRGNKKILILSLLLILILSEFAGQGTQMIEKAVNLIRKPQNLLRVESLNSLFFFFHWILVTPFISKVGPILFF